MTINQPQFIDEVARDAGITRFDAEKIFKLVLLNIKGHLLQGDLVNFQSFGQFYVKQYKTRAGYNPATKGRITIHSSKVVKFKAGKTLNEVFNQEPNATDNPGVPAPSGT